MKDIQRAGEGDWWEGMTAGVGMGGNRQDGTGSQRERQGWERQKEKNKGEKEIKN